MITIQDWPHWLFVALIIVVVIATGALNNIFFSWLRTHFPWALRPRTLFVILAIGVVAIIVGLLANPPSEIRKVFENKIRTTGTSS